MPALSGPDTAIWRGQHWTQGYLVAVKPEVLFQARVNQASYTYPLHEIAIDAAVGSTSSVKIDSLITIGTSPLTDDLGKTRIRKAISTTLMHIGMSSQGTNWGTVDPADDAYVTCWDTFPPLFKAFRVDDNGVLYKDYDWIYSWGINTWPVVNMGPHYAGFVDETTGKLTLSVDGSGSYVTEDGATITDYIWNFGSGSTSPNGVTGATIADVEFDPGNRFISLTVQDSNGRISIGRRLVVALERTGENAPLYNFTVLSRRLTQSGQDITFQIHDDLPATEYPPGSMILYIEHEHYGNTQQSLAGPASRESLKFVGYLTDLQSEIKATRDGVETVTTVNATDAMGMMRKTRGFSHWVENTTSTPTAWDQMENLTIDRIAHNLLQWNSSLLTTTDFYWSGTGADARLPRYSGDEGDLYGQINRLSNAIAHVFTCDMRGRVHMKPDPFYQDTADRTSVVQVDLGEEWSLARYTEPYPSVGLVSGEALKSGHSDPTPLFCKAPGSIVPSVGLGTETWSARIVANQTALNAQTGHYYARRNSDVGIFDVEIPQGGDAGIEPAYLEWVTMTLSADVAAQRGLTFTQARFLPLELRYRYNPETGAVQQRLRLEKETVGRPAVTIPNVVDINLYGVDGPSTDFDYEPDYSGAQVPLAPGTGTIAAFLTDGIAITNDWTTLEASGGPTWSLISLTDLKAAGLSASVTTIYGATVDAYSPLYINGIGAVNAWMVSDQGVHRITSIFGSYAVTNVHTWANPGSGITIHYAIHSERAQQNLVAALQYRGKSVSNQGTRVATSSDGTSFTEVLLSGHWMDTVTDNARPAVFVSGKLANTVYATPFTQSGSFNARSTLYKSTNAGTSWAATTSPINMFSEGSRTSLHIPFDGHTDDTIMYVGRRDYDNLTRFYRFDPTVTPISPGPVGPVYQQAVSSDPDNRQLMGLCARGGTNVHGLYTSQDAGTNWSLVFSNTPNVHGTHVVQGSCYFFGTTSRIGYMDNFSATPDSRVGNLSTLSSGDIVQIIGG